MTTTLTELLGSKARNKNQVRRELARICRSHGWGIMSAGKPECRLISIPKSATRTVKLFGVDVPIDVVGTYMSRNFKKSELTSGAGVRAVLEEVLPVMSQAAVGRGR